MRIFSSKWLHRPQADFRVRIPTPDQRMLFCMRFWTWAGLCSIILLLLWLIPHTTLVSTIQSYVVTPPPPPLPSAPGPPWEIFGHYGVTEWAVLVDPKDNPFNPNNNSAVIALGNGSSPCIGGVQVKEVQVKDGTFGTASSQQATTDPVATLVIAGQQKIDLEKQRLEFQKQHDESLEKRTRLYAQGILTLLLVIPCSFLLINKKTTPTQRTAAIGVLGIALGYWFKP